MAKANKQVTIDILMATYNSNIRFLKIQIESILKQTYKNIHLIISDDASTNPEVKKVLKDYAKQDERITLFLNTENRGYLKNFEFLLQQSDAEYVAFADHDDVWYANKIKKSIETLWAKNVDLVYCDAEQINEEGMILHKSYMEYKNMPKIEGKEQILAFSRHIAIGCSQLFTKKIKEQMLPFTENTMAHDWISVYLASKQKGVAYIAEPLFGYRLHTKNEFGGRSFKQNITKWKEQQGKGIKGYKAYRKRVIIDAYQKGSMMCKEYRDKLGLPKNNEEEKVLQYYRKIEKTKIVNIHFLQYKKYLAFPGIKKRALKEMMIFHFPVFSYFVYRVR